MADSRHFDKTVKSPYLCNRLTDFYEIWYGDAWWSQAPDVKLFFLIFNNLIMLYSRYLENRKHCLSIFCNFTMTRYTILITDEKLQKSLKR